MKKMLFAAVFLAVLAPRAHAAQQTFTTISSMTSCAVYLSTNTTRVDNYSIGGSSWVSQVGCDGLLDSRNEVKIVNPTGNPTINCGYKITVSTLSSSIDFGEEIVAGAKLDMNLGTGVPYFCRMQGVAISTIQVQQAAPERFKTTY